MEIHIFNPVPYYCSLFEGKDGLHTVFDDITASVERLAESSVMEHSVLSGSREGQRYYTSPYAPSIFPSRVDAVIAAIRNLRSTCNAAECGGSVCCDRE